MNLILKPGILCICLMWVSFSFSQFREFIKVNIQTTALIYKPSSNNSLKSHGVGFFFHLYKSDLENLGTPFITCKHLTYHDTLVIAVPAADSIKKILNKEKLSSIKYNSSKGNMEIGFDGSNFLQKVTLKPDSNLFRHPSLDIAIIFFPAPGILMDGTNKEVTRLTNLKGIPKSIIGGFDDLQPGFDIIFIGFPFGIGSYTGFQSSKLFSDFTVNPVIRKGIISWKSSNSDSFLIDGFSYGGNSGSPIFSVPNFEHEGRFIGMINGHLPDIISVSDIDSLGKIKPTSYFVKPNNGLAVCIPSYVISRFVDDTIDNILKRK